MDRPPTHQRSHSRGLALAAALLGVIVGDRVGHAQVKRVDLATLTRLATQGPQAEMARQRTNIARARVDEVSAAKLPKFEITAFAAPSPDITCSNTECTQTDPIDGLTGYAGVHGGARITAMQPLYGFGRAGPIMRAVRAAAQATEQLEHAAVADLAVNAAQAYYGLKLARELVWMLEDGLAEIDKAAEALEELLEEGTGEATVQDRLRVQTLRAEVEARLSEAKQAEAVALAAVRGLAGDAAIEIDTTPLAPVEMSLGDLDDHVARARTSRAELKAARSGAQAARAKHQFERAQHRPVLSLFAEYEVSRASGLDEPPSIYAHDPYNRHNLQFGVSLRWKIDWFTQRARVRGAEAQARQADALVEVAQAATEFDVQRTYAEAREAQARVHTSAKGEQSAKSWVASLVQAQAVGTVDSKEFGDALIAYFTLKSRHVTSVYEWNVVTVKLRRARGESLTDAPPR